jgi:hypothetical protein
MNTIVDYQVTETDLSAGSREMEANTRIMLDSGYQPLGAPTVLVGADWGPKSFQAWVKYAEVAEPSKLAIQMAYDQGIRLGMAAMEAKLSELEKKLR